MCTCTCTIGHSVKSTQFAPNPMLYKPERPCSKETSTGGGFKFCAVATGGARIATSSNWNRLLVRMCLHKKQCMLGGLRAQTQNAKYAGDCTDISKHALKFAFVRVLEIDVAFNGVLADGSFVSIYMWTEFLRALLRELCLARTTPNHATASREGSRQRQQRGLELARAHKASCTIVRCQA